MVKVLPLQGMISRFESGRGLVLILYHKYRFEINEQFNSRLNYAAAGVVTRKMDILELLG